jgi:hypothetical protein
MFTEDNNVPMSYTFDKLVSIQINLKVTVQLFLASRTGYVSEKYQVLLENSKLGEQRPLITLAKAYISRTKHNFMYLQFYKNIRHNV